MRVKALNIIQAFTTQKWFKKLNKLYTLARESLSLWRVSKGLEKHCQRYCNSEHLLPGAKENVVPPPQDEIKLKQTIFWSTGLCRLSQCSFPSMFPMEPLLRTLSSPSPLPWLDGVNRSSKEARQILNPFFQPNPILPFLAC